MALWGRASGGLERLHRGSGSVVVDAQRLWEAAQRLCSSGGGGAGGGGGDGGILRLIGCIGLLPVSLEAFGPCKLLGVSSGSSAASVSCPSVVGGFEMRINLASS